MLLHFLVLIFGVISGTITGLLPSIHNNLVTTILLTSGFLYKIPTDLAIIYVVAISVTHTFVDYIPSVYFFSVSADSAVSFNSSQRLFNSGQAHLAINNTIKGSIIAIFVFLTFYIPMILFVPKIYSKLEIMFPWMLFWILVLSVYRAKYKKETIFVILLCGMIGFFALNSNINQPLLPMLTGFFGVSNLFLSKENKDVVEQKIGEEIITIKEIKRIFLKILPISPFCALLPGFGAGQASILIPSKKDDKEVMTLLGAINTLILCLSFFTLFIVRKSRSGAAGAIAQVTFLNEESILMVIFCVLVVSVIAAFTTNLISKKMAKMVSKINLSLMKRIILVLTFILIFVICGFYGVILFIISILSGILSSYFCINKSNMMSCTLIPTIFYYLPFI